jgi:hypothetical protein
VDLLEAQQLEGKPVVDAPAFAAFADAAAACADHPVAGLLQRGTSSEVRLGTTKVEGKWLTMRPRTVDDITIAVNLDRTRLHMLRGQCAAWGGPVSVSVYQTLQYFKAAENAAVVADLKAELAALHGELEAGGGCGMDIVLVSELRHPDQAWAYPYNTMRNQALVRARSVPRAGGAATCAAPGAFRGGGVLFPPARVPDRPHRRRAQDQAGAAVGRRLSSQCRHARRHAAARRLGGGRPRHLPGAPRPGAARL